VSSFNFKKKFGQNFLKDSKILNDIVNSIPIKEDDLVIEIGPGAGALTKCIKNTKCRLICYEIDTELERYLSLLEDDKTKIIYDDFLNRDIGSDIENVKYDNLYIVANLPYYITTPIIEKIINSNLNINSCIFMVQKEVADRLSSKEGNKEYGYISVLLSYYFDINKLFNVNKECFEPIPKVDSAVIKMVSKNNKRTTNMEIFKRLIKDSFRMKRKNIKNNLYNYDLKLINNVLVNYNLNLQNRAEDIPLDCFLDIVETICKN